jgi:hypothetical protein
MMANMKSSWRILSAFILTGIFLLSIYLPADADARHRRPRPVTLQYHQDRATGKIMLTWTGRAGLECSIGSSGRFERLTAARSPFVIEPTSALMQFRVAGGVVSDNIVGYVNTTLPPGLSLITNPLRNTTNTLGHLFPAPPDGTQVYRLDGTNYAVSTFDAMAGAWSNPALELLPGDGFFVRNPSGAAFINTFVGEVLIGTLVNPLPAGNSLQADMVPQGGSINSIHRVPGQSGDRAYKFAPAPDGTEGWIESAFDTDLNQWVPDLFIQVGEGFMVYKQAPQDWVRIFSPF